MRDFIYNVPVWLAEKYRGQKRIVRTYDPSNLVGHVLQSDFEDLVCVQLLSLEAESKNLASWGEHVPVDIVMLEPALQFPSLYKFAKLLETHPVRVSLRVEPGFGKAVKLALALHFAVKLEVGQPDAALIEEMAEVLDLYLHQSGITQPVEFFHSVFLHFYRQEQVNLWLIQEEDPEQFCFVTDDGEETISPRFGRSDLKAGPESPVGERFDASQSEISECDTCKYFDCCGGYFKWPEREFCCTGVKTLFRTIREAAVELKSDLAVYAALPREFSE